MNRPDPKHRGPNRRPPPGYSPAPRPILASLEYLQIRRMDWATGEAEEATVKVYTVVGQLGSTFMRVALDPLFGLVHYQGYGCPLEAAWYLVEHMDKGNEQWRMHTWITP